MFCPKCGTENTGAVCTNCGNNLQSQSVEKPKKKPIYKRWWFWLIAVVAILIIIIGASSGGDSGELGSSVSTGEIKTDSTNVVENVAEYEINRVFVTTKLEALIEGYTYYEAESGKEYVVVDTNVKNLTSQWVDTQELIGAGLTVEGTVYKATNFIVSEDDIDQYGGVDALESVRMYFAVQVPQGANTDGMILAISCGDKVSTCNVSVSEYDDKKEYITLGKEYTDNETMSVQFEKVFFTNRLDPPKTDSAHSYYEAETGKKYLVTKFKVKNLKGSSLSDDDVTGIKCVYDGKYTYDGFICTEDEDGSDLDSYTSIEPLDTRTMYYLIEVPTEVEKGSAELEIYLMGQTYYLKVK